MASIRQTKTTIKKTYTRAKKKKKKENQNIAKVKKAKGRTRIGNRKSRA